jgi:multiple sugar transport system permease protein
MVPTVLLMGGIIAYPFLRAVYISFTNTVSVEIGPFVGLKNYIDVWGDQFFRRSLWITTKYTVASVVLKVIFGTLIAVLLNRLGRWGGILTGLVLLPWIVPDIVRAITWKSVLDPIYGGANRLLLDLNIIDKPLLFLSGIKSALPTLVMINLWQGIPFFTINLLAGLKAIDKELYEAAAIDGASGWRQFLHVTLPGLRYVLIVVTLLSTIWTFNTFTIVFLLTGGGPMDATKVYSILSYSWGIGAHMYGKGIAVALSMAPILLLVIVILGRYMMRGRRLYDIETEREPGAFGSKVGAWLLWPFKAFLAVFWAINNASSASSRPVASSAAIPTIRKAPKWTGKILPNVTLACSCFELLPFYWVIVTAFKTELQVTRFENVFWPTPWTLDQFRGLLGPHNNFLTWMKNTLIVSTATAILATIVAAAGAYALTRLHWRGPAVLQPGAGGLPDAGDHDADSHLSALRRAEIDQHPVGVDPILPHLQPALRHLADDGLLRGHPGGVGGCGAGGRVQPLPGVHEGGAAADQAGVDGRGAVRRHPGVERVSVRLRVHPERIEDDHPGQPLADDHRRRCRGPASAAALLSHPVLILYIVGQKIMVLAGRRR